MPQAMSPDSSIEGFLTVDEIVHLRGTHDWGQGVACDSALPLGSRIQVLVREISCERCLDLLPDQWEVRVPDRRTSEGYRVLMSGLDTEQAAQHFAEKFDQRRSSSASGVEVARVSLRDVLKSDKRK